MYITMRCYHDGTTLGNLLLLIIIGTVYFSSCSSATTVLGSSPSSSYHRHDERTTTRLPTDSSPQQPDLREEEEDDDDDKRRHLQLDIGDFSVLTTTSEFEPESSTSTTNNTTTTRPAAVVAGGAGYGVAIDANRADVISLRYHDIPSEEITVEFWYKVLDPHVYIHSIFSYSVYTHLPKEDDTTTSTTSVYEEANELSFMIGNHVLVLWGAGSRMRIGRETDPRVQQPCQDLEWHHYAFTWSMAKAQVNFYMDGEQLDFGNFQLFIQTTSNTTSGDPGENSTNTTATSDSQTEIDYTNQPFGFGSHWDTPVHNDSLPYGEHNFSIHHVKASEACNASAYNYSSSTMRTNASKVVVLLEWSPSSNTTNRNCSERIQADLAMQFGGAFAVVFFPTNSSKDIDPKDLPQLNDLEGDNANTTVPTIEFTQPVLWISYADAQSLLIPHPSNSSSSSSNNNQRIIFSRSKSGIASTNFRKPITQGGVLVIGQEADKPWGDFDSLQAAAGVLDEVRIWDRVRTPQEIATNYKLSIDTTSSTADATLSTLTEQEQSSSSSSLNLYWNFDDIYNSSSSSNPLVVKDLSPLGTHPGLVGALPTLKNEMTYLDKPPRPPTRPVVLPVSSLPLVGMGEVVVPVVAGQFTVLELKSLAGGEGGRGGDLTTVLESLPEFGLLYNLEKDDLYQVGDVVVDPNRTENKRIRFLAPENFDDSDHDAIFTYSVSLVEGGEVETAATATVRFIPYQILQPVSDTTTIAEDTMQYMALTRPSQLTQTNLRVVITVLPERGSLFQAEFPNIDSTYDEVQPGARINETGTLVTDNRGIVLYKADLHEFSDPPEEAYAIFQFQFHDEDAKIWSDVGTKLIVVTAQNDAPNSLDTNVTTTTTSSITLQLKSKDVDADYVDSFAKRSFSRVTEFPKGGRLYQFVDINKHNLVGNSSSSSADHNKGILMDGSVLQVPMSFQWASNVIRFSSQYSPCGPACMTWKNPECTSSDILGGGSVDGTCPETSWHASNILGPPNFYPEYGDSRLLWEPNSQNGGNEFIELELSYEMYINAIEIYETYKPGAVWKVSAAAEYLDDISVHCSRSGVEGVSECSQTTDWELLWSKPREKVSPGPERATIFEPPLCQSTKKSKVVRIDLDTGRVPGWNGYDAVKVTGSLDYPPGLVSDEHNRIVFVPMDGVHGLDRLSFDSSDCISEGEEGVYNIEVQAPSQGQFSSSVLDVTYLPIHAEPNKTSVHQLDFSPVLQRIEDILGEPLNSSTATVWFTDALGVKPGTIFQNITAENSTIALEVGATDFGKPLSHVEIWLNDPTTSLLTFRIRYAIILSITCIHGQPDKESGKCLCKTPRWTGSDCSIEVEENMNQVPGYMEAIMYFYFALLVAMCLGFAALVYNNRNALIIKVSQPFFLYTLLLGSLFTSFSIPARVATHSDAACTISYWIFFVGFSFVYGSLLAKIWRTYQVFMSGMQMRRKVVSVHETLFIIAALVSMNILVLSLWTALDPASWQRTVLLDDGDGYSLSSVGECKSTTDSPYIIACFALNLGAMCLGVILCFQARKIPDKFSETYAVNFSTYIALNVCIIGIPVLILVQDDPSATLFVECSIVFSMVFAVLSCIFSNLISWLYMENETSVKRAIEDSVRVIASGGRSKVDSHVSMDSSYQSQHSGRRAQQQQKDTVVARASSASTMLSSARRSEQQRSSASASLAPSKQSSLTSFRRLMEASFPSYRRSQPGSSVRRSQQPTSRHESESESPTTGILSPDSAKNECNLKVEPKDEVLEEKKSSSDRFVISLESLEEEENGDDLEDNNNNNNNNNVFDGEISPATAAAAEAEKDRFLLAVESLDEVEYLLRQHPDLLESETLSLLHRRIGTVQTLAQQLSLATS